MGLDGFRVQGYRVRAEGLDGFRVQVSGINVAALLVLWASLMRFFVSLFKPAPKKCPAQIMLFFFGGGVGGVLLLCANGQS